MKVLVAGGTGMLGSPVVRQLLATGHGVRVLTRRPRFARALFNDEVEIAHADVTEPSTLPAAVEGCDALHVSLRGANDWRDYDAVEHRGLCSLLRLAREYGFRKVSYLSGAGEIQGNEALPPVRVKLEAEAAIRASGLPYVIFRATHFMESLELFIRGKWATVIGAQRHRYHYLAAADFGQLVARALDSELAGRQELYVFGPEPFTMREALTQYIQCVRPEIRLSNMPLTLARMVATLTGNRDLRFAAELFAAFDRIGEAGDPRATDRMFGRPSTRLSQWLLMRAEQGLVRVK